METLYQSSTVRPSPFNMNIPTLPISYFSVVFLISIQPSKPFVALMCSKCWCQWLPWFKAIIFSSQLSSAHNFFSSLAYQIQIERSRDFLWINAFFYIYSNLKKKSELGAIFILHKGVLRLFRTTHSPT